jgi:uncharacterized iron-regulated protein
MMNCHHLSRTMGHAFKPTVGALGRASLAALFLIPAAAEPAEPARPKVLIFGEQHDQPDQQRQVAASVRQLAATGHLAALVLEMAEVPSSTAGLTRDASEAQVREALRWSGWPWEPYAEVVMDAVRAGVPVWGGNLPRSEMRAAIADGTLDTRIAREAREHIAQAVRDGHCGLLPAAQEPGMVRIQIARDQSMAQVIEAALQRAPPGQQVMLLAGAYHASRDRGVPLHLLGNARLDSTDMHVVMFGSGSTSLRADEQRPAEFTPQPDPCEALRKRQAAAQAASAPSSPAR